MKLAVGCLIFAGTFFAFAASVPAHQRHRQLYQKPNACAAQPEVNLKPLLDKYHALLDFDDIVEFLVRKLEGGDPDTLRLLAYFLSEDANTIVDYLWDEPAYTELVKWMYNNGLTRIYNAINEVHAIFGWRPVGFDVQIQAQHGRRRHARSIGDFVSELMELIPVDQMINQTFELIARKDEALLAFIARMTCQDLAELWFRLKEMPECQRSVEFLRSEGVPIDHIITLLETIFGWREIRPISSPVLARKSTAKNSENLSEAWHKIKDVIEVEGLKQFWPEFQQMPCGQLALDYVRGEEFQQLITDFYAEQQFKNVMNWMQSHGLKDLFEFIAAAHSELGIPPPPYQRQTQTGQCTPEEWATIRAKLNTYIPEDKLTDTIYELITKDEAIQELLKLLASNPVDAAYHHFRSQASYQVLLQKLRDAGFQIDELITTVEALMGWDNRPRQKPL